MIFTNSAISLYIFILYIYIYIEANFDSNCALHHSRFNAEKFSGAVLFFQLFLLDFSTRPLSQLLSRSETFVEQIFKNFLKDIVLYPIEISSSNFHV